MSQSGVTPDKNTTWNNFDTEWVLGLFGTAVGAGILFLPISFGKSGPLAMAVLAVLVLPMTYLAHRALTRFVHSSAKPGSDITEVVTEHFGPNAGNLITLLYFFAIYPILLIYGVGITNTVNSFWVNQLHLSPVPRPLLSLVLITAMVGVMLAGERIMLRVTEWLVYPLCAILFFLSVYLIPHWDFSVLEQSVPLTTTISSVWLGIPVLIFAFNHSPAISSFALAYHREYVDQAEIKASRTLFRTAGILFLFAMFFVFSCVLSLTPEDMAEAERQNIAVLSYLANRYIDPWIAYPAPFIAFFAIASSFFGHYLGAREGLRGLVLKAADARGIKVNRRKLDWALALFFILTLWGVAVLEPGILGMIESLGGPVIAMILFLMPMYAIRKIPAMRKYQGAWSNVFVTLIGLIAITAILMRLA